MCLADDNIYYSRFSVHGLKQLGEIIVARTRKGVCCIELLGPIQGRTDIPDCHMEQEQAFTKDLETRLKKKALQDHSAVNDIRDALIGYLAGNITTFNIPVDLSTGTQFQQHVWRKLTEIPFGEVRTYKWVAEGIGSPKGVRAVGQACGRNPVPIVIPCHRVIRSDGSLGGFSSGIAQKKELLRLEGLLHLKETNQ